MDLRKLKKWKTTKKMKKTLEKQNINIKLMTFEYKYISI